MDVREGFTKYGTAGHSRRKVQRARAHEELYKKHGVYGDAPDLTTIPTNVDKEFVALTNVKDEGDESDEDMDEDAWGG